MTLPREQEPSKAACLEPRGFEPPRPGQLSHWQNYPILRSLDRRNWRPGASWWDALTTICNRLAAQPLTAETCAALQRLTRLDADPLDQLAKAVPFFEISEAERATGCLVFAALQVHWTGPAGLIDGTGFHSLDRPDACPVCGSPHVASLVHSMDR